MDHYKDRYEIFKFNGKWGSSPQQRQEFIKRGHSHMKLDFCKCRNK